MSATLKQVAEEAKSLSFADRSALTRILIESLDVEPAEDLAEVEQAWQVEVAKRVEEIKSGRVKTIPAEEVFARLRAKHG